jgi:hypothetical protein
MARTTRQKSQLKPVFPCALPSQESVQKGDKDFYPVYLERIAMIIFP